MANAAAGRGGRRWRGLNMTMRLRVLLLAQTAAATAMAMAVTNGPAAAAAASPPDAIVVAVKPSLALASLSGAMNGAGMEELNHEIYGGVYSQMVHGESFEETPGTDGVSGQLFTNYWSASRSRPAGDDGNSTYITWQPLGANRGCTFSASATAVNGNHSQSVACSAGSGCSCDIVNRGVDAVGFTFGTSDLQGYLFAQLPSGGSPAAVSVAVELIDEKVRGECADSTSCPVLARQIIPVRNTTGWQKLAVSLTQINDTTTKCLNSSAGGQHFVRCVGQYGGGNPGYFPVEGHEYEENVCLTCTGTIRLRVLTTGAATMLLDQFFLSPTSVYGGNLARLPARIDIGRLMEQTWQALRFGGGTADGAEYRWKQWRGPRWLRPPMANRNYEWHSNGRFSWRWIL